MFTLRTQVFAGLEKRTDKYLTSVFDYRKDKDTNMLPVTELSAALRDVSICDSDLPKVSPSEISSLSQSITFGTFKRFAGIYSALDNWAKSVPLWQLLSDSIPRQLGVRHLFIAMFLWFLA